MRLRRKLGHGEGFDHDLHAMRQKAVSNGGVLSIAGDEQHLQIGAGLPRGVSHLAAVHAPSEPHVGDQEIDPAVRSQDVQTRRAP